MECRLLCKSPHDPARRQHFREPASPPCSLLPLRASRKSASRPSRCLVQRGLQKKVTQSQVGAHLSSGHLGSCWSETVLLLSWTFPKFMHGPASSQVGVTSLSLQAWKPGNRQPGGRGLERAGTRPRARRGRASGGDGLEAS